MPTSQRHDFTLSTRYEKKVSKDLFSIGNNAELEAASGCLDFHLCKKNLCIFHVTETSEGLKIQVCQ